MAFSSFLYVFTEMLLILSIAFVVICSLFLLLSIVATLVMFRRARVSWYVEIVSSFSKQRQRGLVLRALRLWSWGPEFTSSPLPFNGFVFGWSRIVASGVLRGTMRNERDFNSQLVSLPSVGRFHTFLVQFTMSVCFSRCPQLVKQC